VPKPGSHVQRTPRPLIIGIAGGSGSGKSTVARRIADGLGGAQVAFIDMDAYYRDHSHLSLDERRHINWDHPDAFELGLLSRHLHALARGEAVEKPVYDFVEHRRAFMTVRVEPADVIVIDGILLLVDPDVRDACDVKVFVDTDADIRLIRRIRRDLVERGRPLDEILDQYLTTVQPMHLQFVEASKRYADIIIPRGGENEVAIDLLLASIARRLDGAPA
jgi:uridine kinase